MKQQTLRFVTRWLPLAGVALWWWSVAPMAAGQEDAVADDTARILAGLPVRGGSGLERVAALAPARAHAAAMEDLWQRWESIRLQGMRSWSAETVQTQIPRPRTLFYLFGGPDLVSAVSLFPGADLYTLGGLEPVGQIPSIEGMSAEELSGSLDQIRFNLRSIQEKGFFETREMRADLARGSVSGVWPILALFAARTGHEVLGWSRVGLDPQGRLIEGGGSGGSQGVRLRVRTIHPGAGFPAAQVVDYFSADVSDTALAADGRYLAYLRSNGQGGAYLKAASYLMHGDGFSRIRSFLLENSLYLLQDASGIPISRLDPEIWEFRMYGRYAGPVDVFREYEQPEMYRWFSGATWRGGLPFGANYRYSDQDAHQMFFLRRSAGQPLTPGSPAAPAAPLRAVPLEP